MGGIGLYGDAENRERGSYGSSQQAGSGPIRNAYERYHGHEKEDRSRDWMRDVDQNRESNRNYGNSYYSNRSNSSPNYDSIQSGGLFDSDRDFTSGGISSMGGDYDRERTRGRQYGGNYDSAGTYIGDYRNQQRDDFSNQERNQYNSDFTFGSGNTKDRYSNRSSLGMGNQNRDRSGWGSDENRWGGRFGSAQDSDPNRGSHYGGSGYNRQWREDSDRNRGRRHSQNPSNPNLYHSRNFNTGNPDYDRHNFGAADYVRDRNRQEDEDRGFFDRATERVRHWFGADDDDRNRY
jgi:hypothetical protein